MLIENLQTQSGLTRSQLDYFSATASKRYKTYTIPKRDGGTREIAHPSRSLKALQRWISKVLISKFPIHSCAFAYRSGSSIRKHALQHANSRFTLRMDFVNFFPSFSDENVQNFISDNCAKHDIDLTFDDLMFVTSIVTRHRSLTIGAPSSPTLTNAMMYQFDARIYKMAKEEDLIYTRYADDMFISARRPNALGDALSVVLQECRNFQYSDLKINNRKTAYLSRRYRRSITGLIVTPDCKVSIGRKRKREIKSLVHRYLTKSLLQEDLDRTRGLIAFSMDADPDFFASLCKKYGRDNVYMILRKSH